MLTLMTTDEETHGQGASARRQASVCGDRHTGRTVLASCHVYFLTSCSEIVGVLKGDFMTRDAMINVLHH